VGAGYLILSVVLWLHLVKKSHKNVLACDLVNGI
jgi:hypothetical protein